jgi:hypothetical protein
MQHTAFYDPIFAFITRIGLPIAEQALAADTFLPGIALRDGGLLVDPDQLIWPGDLLHEAGHLAVLPASMRTEAHDDDLSHADVEHAGELEAMAWAYAAAVELALPVEVLIHDGGYHGKARDLLQMYTFGVYPGLRGLCESGMAAAHGFTPDCGPLQYPKMLRWLRD